MKKLLAIIFAMAAALAAAAAKPSAVSLDYCADQYLLALADDDQILAVSRGADKHYSYMREAAAPFHKIRASMEEALVLKPDIIFRQWGGGANAESAFGRLAQLLFLSATRAALTASLTISDWSPALSIRKRVVKTLFAIWKNNWQL